MSKPDLTIGISFKNPGPFFGLALQSVFAQSFRNWELILIDDGSTDGSVELAGSLRDPRVRVYHDGQSKSLNVRLNELVRLATGKFFVRMDADDAMHPDRLQRQVEILEKNARSTVVGSAAYSMDKESRIIGFRPARQCWREFWNWRKTPPSPTTRSPAFRPVVIWVRPSKESPTVTSRRAN